MNLLVFFGELFHLTQLKDFLTAWSFFRKPRDNVFTIIQSFANVYSGIVLSIELLFFFSQILNNAALSTTETVTQN